MSKATEAKLAKGLPMGITLAQAKALKPGDILIDERGYRWRVNGQVKRWKREPDRVSIPIKHGLKSYDTLTNADLHRVRVSM